jgi:hypothetical protein
MSDATDRLRAELELAEACEVLEEAREALHADRNEETIADYKAACDTVAPMRAAFREKWEARVGPGDAAPHVETVAVTSEAKLR